MKFQLCRFLPLLFLVARMGVQAQGTFIYDQESSTDETAFSGAGAVIQPLTPYGQSFTPSLSAVSFVRLNLNDNQPSNGLGVTLFLKLRTNSISGSVLANTFLISLTNGFAGPVNFIFPSDVPLTPSATYAFEIVVQSGDLWNALAGEYNYAGGMVFANGFPAPGSDLWFREGIYSVPEPSSLTFLFIGGAIGVWRVRRKPANQQ